MDFISLGRERTTYGLGKMLEAALNGVHGYTDSNLVEVPTALMIIEIAKIAEDRDEWFPAGKWATIQAMQEQVERELQTLFPH